MSRPIEVADRISGEYRNKLSSFAEIASKQAERGCIDLEIARKIALRKGELNLSSDILDPLINVLAAHYGLRNKSNKENEEYLRDFGSLVSMEQRYAVNGCMAAYDFNNFQSRYILTEEYKDKGDQLEGDFTRFANFCYGSVIISLSEKDATKGFIKGKRLDRLLKKGAELVAETVTGIGTERFDKLVKSDDIYRMVLRFERLKLPTFQALQENTCLNIEATNHSSIRLSRVLIMRRELAVVYR